MAYPNLSLEVVMIQEEEVRRVDGRGSWQRNGASVLERKLLRVLETFTFETKEDFLRFLPGNLEQPFSNQSLAECLSCSIDTARRMTYCLKKMGVIQEIGKNGRRLLFKVVQV